MLIQIIGWGVDRQTIRWGVVGLGSVTRTRFVPALSRSTRSVLAACVSSNHDSAKAFSDEHELTAYASLDELLSNSDIDVVYLASPNSLHYAQTRLALRANKHVLCEKPLALTIQEGKEAVELATDRNRLLKIAYQFRFEPVFERARDLISTGTIGDLRVVRLFGCAATTRPIGGWRQDPREGGVISDLAVHLLDLIPWISGLQLQNISARANPPDVMNAATETTTMLGTLGDRCHCVISASRETPHGRNSFSFEGSTGALSCGAWRGVINHELVLKTDSGESAERLAPADMFGRVIKAFEEELDGKNTQLATGSDGIRAIAYATAIRESASAGGTLILPQWP